jgi:uncharacterized membrane protein
MEANGRGESAMRIVKTVTKWVCALFYIGAGVNHFVNPDFYLRIMPPYLNYHLPLVYISGVAEIVLGVMLLIPQFTRKAAWGIILLLIAVFPANIYVYQHQDVIDSDLSNTAHLIRLALQGVLILWAYWYTTPDAARDAAVPVTGRAE